MIKGAMRDHQVKGFGRKVIKWTMSNDEGNGLGMKGGNGTEGITANGKKTEEHKSRRYEDG